MKNICIILCTLCLAVTPSQARDFKWKRDAMDGSRTGVTVPGKDNVKEALGEVSGGVWTSPSGKIFRSGSAPKVAALVIAAQPSMSIVKEVVGYAPEDMVKQAPESSLTNWYIDNFMVAAEEITGQHIDLAVGNFGGVRVNLAAGDVLYDDIRSMFPFRNQVVYIPVKGSEVIRILEEMAASKIEILGGVRIAVREKKLVSAEIGGKPIDPEKVYGMASISFLVTGGDGLKLEDHACGEIIWTDTDIFDAMMSQVRKAQAERRPIAGKVDSRVKIL